MVCGMSTQISGLNISRKGRRLISKVSISMFSTKFKSGKKRTRQRAKKTLHRVSSIKAKKPNQEVVEAVSDADGNAVSTWYTLPWSR